MSLAVYKGGGGMVIQATGASMIYCIKLNIEKRSTSPT